MIHCLAMHASSRKVRCIYRALTHYIRAYLSRSRIYVYIEIIRRFVDIFYISIKDLKMAHFYFILLYFPFRLLGIQRVLKKDTPGFVIFKQNICILKIKK